MRICLFGGRGAGKDTVLEILQRILDNPKQMRLAGYVVDACKAFGIEEPTRTDLAFIGTEIGRNMIGKDVWINKGLQDVKNNPNLDWILTDCRFPNEYDAFVNIGFVPILIDCELETRIERVIKRDGTIDMELLKTESENAYKSFPYAYKLDNNGTIKELEKQVWELVFVHLMEY